MPELERHAHLHGQKVHFETSDAMEPRRHGTISISLGQRLASGFWTQPNQEQPRDIDERNRRAGSGVTTMIKAKQASHFHCSARPQDPPGVVANPLSGRPNGGWKQLRQ